jgi:signal peptidase II
MTNRIFFIVIVLVSCVGCDQSTKAVAETYLTETQMWSFWGDTFRLQLAYNHGAFLSLGLALPEAWRAGIFSVGTGLMLVGLFVYTLFSKAISKFELLALSLLLAGGIGNLVDRIAYGYVIDFMNIGIGILRSGIFNVADIAVTLGVLLLIIKTMFFIKPENN